MGAGFSGVPPGSPFGLPSTVSGATPATRLPGRGQGAAEAEPAPAAALASAAPPGALDAHLRSLRNHLGDCYAFGACALGDGSGELWTALRHDAVPGYRTADWLTCATWAELAWQVRCDHEARPVPHGRRLRYRDDLLERLCARFPGWAVVRLADDRLLGRRGHVEAGPVVMAAMGSAIGQASFEAARSACPGA
jgi:hypothetical protein